MVKDNVNHYFTSLLECLKAEYEGIDGGQKYVESPPSFPHVHFKQIGGEGALETLSGTEEGINLAVEIKIYAKKLNEARNIANTVRQWGRKKGFHIDYFSPEENIKDSSVNQFIIRISKIDV